MNTLCSLTPFGLKCRELRLRADRRIIEQADMLGISAAEITDYEIGRKIPSEEYIRRTAYWLRVEAAQLEALLLRGRPDGIVVSFERAEMQELRESRRLLRKTKSLSAMVVQLDDYRGGDQS